MPETPPDGDRLLTTVEVADVCRVAPNTVEHWRTHRLGPAYIKVGRQVRYRRADVEAWIDSRAARQ